MILDLGYQKRVAQTVQAPRRLALGLSQLGEIASRRFAELLIPLDVTPAEAGVIRLLQRHPGISQRQLADRLGAAPSRMVVLLDSLENKGHVRRRRSAQDRRNHELALTRAGAAVFRRIRRVAQTPEQETLAALSEPERNQLAVLLAKLATAHGLDSQGHPGYAAETTER